MRTRSKPTVELTMVQTGVVPSINGQPGWSWSGNKEAYKRSEVITDVSGRKTDWHPVSHVIDVHRCVPESFTFRPSSDLRRLGRCWNVSLAEGTYAGGLPALDYASAWNALMDDACGMMPRDTAVLTNIAELASLKSLVPSIMEGALSLFRRRSTHRRVWKSTVRDLAGSHLAVEFGLMPLIQDLKHFMTLRQRVKEKLRIMAQRDGRTLVLRAACKNVEFQDSATFPDVTWGNSYSEVSRRVKILYQASGGVSITATTAMYSDPGAELRLWIGALGLNNPVGVVWELVPFSFVIDWFLPIGKLIDTMELPRTLGAPAMVSLSNPQMWMKTRMISEFSARSESFPNCDFRNIVSDGSGKHIRVSKLYRRQPMPINEVAFNAPPEWSIRKSALSFSLMAQKAIRK